MNGQDQHAKIEVLVDTWWCGGFSSRRVKEWVEEQGGGNGFLGSRGRLEVIGHSNMDVGVFSFGIHLKVPGGVRYEVRNVRRCCKI